jgi:1-deoxy-D-xylulose-5-phosphate reductoisomerase
MAEFSDGSTIAQLSMPDMRLPIGYALAYPNRIGTPFGRIDWTSLRRLDFEEPDTRTFRCLALAYEAGRAGGSAPAWLNAANEVVVDAFLGGRIDWLDIAALLASALDRHEPHSLTTVGDVVQVDARAREVARSLLP